MQIRRVSVYFTTDRRDAKPSKLVANLAHRGVAPDSTTAFVFQPAKSLHSLSGFFTTTNPLTNANLVSVTDKIGRHVSIDKSTTYPRKQASISIIASGFGNPANTLPFDSRLKTPVFMSAFNTT